MPELDCLGSRCGDDHHQAAAELQRAGRYRDAERMVARGLALHPGDLRMLCLHAGLAMQCGEVETALARCDAVIAAHPDSPAGYSGKAEALREAGRLQEAGFILACCVHRFPGHDEFLVGQALVAQAGRDWPAANQLWRQVRCRIPSLISAYIANASVLRELGCLAEAQACLQLAAETFPQDASVAVAFAELLSLRCDFGKAAESWASIRDRFPPAVAVYCGLVTALHQLHRHEEADAQLGAALGLFPDAEAVWTLSVSLLSARGRFGAALQQCEMLRQRFPAVAGPRAMLARLLQSTDDQAQSDRVISDGLAAFPDHPALLMAAAEIATARRAWDSAIDWWRQVVRSDPDNAAAIGRLGDALRSAGRLAEATCLLDAAESQYPGIADILFASARLAEQRLNWRGALDRWRAIRHAFPGHASADEAFANALWHCRQEAEENRREGDAGVARPASAGRPGPFSPDCLAVAPGIDDAGLTLADMMMLFESLGDDCEFAAVQRKAGAEPLGLLRFASINAENLVRALDNGFQAFGAPDQLQWHLDERGEYFIYDQVAGFRMHTFIQEHAISPDRLMPKQTARIGFLRRKMLEDLAEARKIFVYKSKEAALTVDLRRRLHRAIRRFGPTTLLCIVPADRVEEIGSVSIEDDGLLVGFVGGFCSAALETVRFDDWFDVCRNAVRLSPPRMMPGGAV